ncbi:MAG: adenylosuccinate lyase [Actinomycetota bacterium]|jgi:adenylosuccinate lyase
MSINDVLATRYASPAMVEIWSAPGKIKLERKFWLQVLKTQASAGLTIPNEAINAYEAQIENIDLTSIANRERALKHDVKARIEEFNALAGFELIHQGLTSRDLTENIEQAQILYSLQLVKSRLIAVLNQLSNNAQAHRELAMVGRTHNVAAQLTTLGKRFASTIEELLIGYQALTELIDRYPARGLKGPVGTNQDLANLFEQDLIELKEFETELIQSLGFNQTLTSVGQVYPRSLDYEVGSLLYQVSAPISSLAMTIRLMAGQELVTEGFLPGQVGSSAMPHKMNARSCERINGLHQVLNGYVQMLAGITGNQWNEGDVSCSVVRRVALPGIFFAIDGIIETVLTVLTGFKVFETQVKAELDRYLPFLLTTEIMLLLVKRGVGRETAHKQVQQHALAAADNLRAGGTNNLFELLVADNSLNLDQATLNELAAASATQLAAAYAQVDLLVAKVAAIVKTDLAAASYQPGAIL